MLDPGGQGPPESPFQLPSEAEGSVHTAPPPRFPLPGTSNDSTLPRDPGVGPGGECGWESHPDLQNLRPPHLCFLICKMG